MIKKLRVAVLLGGNSHEKEISLESGRNVVYKLSTKKYETIPVFVDALLRLHVLTTAQLVANSTHEIEEIVKNNQPLAWDDLSAIADFVFIALHGGLGENGGVQGALEMLGLPYNGSSILASALCMDKYKTTFYLRNAGFDVPHNILINNDEWQDKEKSLATILNQLCFPLIVKPHDDGCSVMVKKVDDKASLEDAIIEILSSGKEYALVEEYVVGMELTVGVLGNDNPQALPPSQAISQHAILSITEKFLPGAGENQTPAPLPQEALVFVQRTIENVFKAVGCRGYARIDCFYQSAEQSPTGKERLVILEINTLPGLTPATCIFHQAAEIGLRPMDFIDQVVQLGLQQHGKEETMAVKKQESSPTLQV